MVHKLLAFADDFNFFAEDSDTFNEVFGNQTVSIAVWTSNKKFLALMHRQTLQK